MQGPSIHLPESRFRGDHYDDAQEPYLENDHDPLTMCLVSIEGTAVQYGILPVQLLRETCTADAENLARKLGRSPRIQAPWLPISTLGPLVIMGHHTPKCDDAWGIPDFLTVKIAISPTQYEAIRRDLVMRIQSRPLRDTSPFEMLPAPGTKHGDLGAAFEWLINSPYPLEDRMRAQLKTAYVEMINRNTELSVASFNAIKEHLGTALFALASHTPALVFNPDEAPKQTLFPAQLLEKHGVYPVYCGVQRVYLLSENADIYNFEDEWLSSGNDPVEMVVVLADEKIIRKTINKYSASNEEISIDITAANVQVSDDANIVEIISEDMMAINPQNVNHTPEELVKWVIHHAIQQRASDLHLEKYYNMARFRARIDGQLKVVYAASEELLPRFIALLKNYSNLGQSRQEAQDGRFSLAIGQRRIDVRVAAVPCRKEQQKVIMRFLDKDGGMKSMTELNLSERQASLFERTMSRDQGLVLVTGPTGSGKTTTLYALLNSVNEDNVNLHTIEDPIEYRIEGINQTQTDPVHGITFLTGLRSLLRSDPDVILIGECRDEETAMAAVTSALTGHLVLTTLHANDSLRAISRLISMGVPSYLLADSLVLSQAQRLVRRLCNYCKRPGSLTDELYETMHRLGVVDAVPNVPIYTKAGCPECNNTGYKGRIALMEICEVNSEIKDLISEEARLRDIRDVARRNGLLSLYQEGLCQVLAGNTTLDEIKGLSY